MMGVAALGVTPPDNESARFHFQHALEMMDKLVEELGSVDFPYQVCVHVCVHFSVSCCLAHHLFTIIDCHHSAH